MYSMICMYPQGNTPVCKSVVQIGFKCDLRMRTPVPWWLVFQISCRMPIPYSLDLRWRVVWFDFVHGFSSKEISDLLCLSERTVCRYITLFHQTGDVKPVSRDRRNRPRKLLGDFEQLQLLHLIIRHPGIYLHELQDKLREAFGVTVQSSTICRTLKYMGCTRQVIRHVALQLSEAMRAKFMAEVSMYNPSMLIWIDESGCM